MQAGSKSKTVENVMYLATLIDNEIETSEINLRIIVRKAVVW